MTTKNTSGTQSAKSNTKTNAKSNGKTKGASNCSGKKASKQSKNSQESDTDPAGSYTGNPVGWGKYAVPVQDADDL